MKCSIDRVIKDLFSYLSHVTLTESQQELVKSMAKYYKHNKRLSERQMATLFEIKKYSFGK